MKSHRICLAPMIMYTDRHFRYLLRLISKHLFLYTEMISANAIKYSYNSERYLDYSEAEHPIALQLGSNNPALLAECAKIAEAKGFDEINLNVGCPSDRVQKGEFGVCLMEKPQLVRECLLAMSEATSIPITIKTRLGLGKNYSFDRLCEFIETVAISKTQCFILHARSAWSNLTPAQNRIKPPIDYEMVYRIKEKYPLFEVVINGDIKTTDEIKQHLKYVDGVMLGRIAYQNPWLFSAIEKEVFNEGYNRQKEEIVEKYLAYARSEITEGENSQRVLKPLMNIYKGDAGAKQWRQTILFKDV